MRKKTKLPKTNNKANTSENRGSSSVTKESGSQRSFFLVRWTEAFLSWRKRHKYIQKERQKRKNFIEDWGGALLWAAVVVLLINQYFFQAYKIPSGSMVDTLGIGDMLFVNKCLYGPELLPGYLKMPSKIEPQRGEIIIFESPEYRGKGVARELINRLVYMLTFSLVNLDKNETGGEAVHFLVKRAVGMEGDFIFFTEKEMNIIPAGLDEPFFEKDLFFDLGANNHTLYRNINGTDLDRYYNDNFMQSYHYFTQNPLQLSQSYDLIYNSFYPASAQGNFALDKPKSISMMHSPRFMAMRDHYGFFVQEDYLLPLGDNRNNSHDARSWGAVHQDKVLGRVALRYWPFPRFGFPQ